MFHAEQVHQDSKNNHHATPGGGKFRFHKKIHKHNTTSGYPPGTKSISHRIREKDSKIIDSTVPTGRGYVIVAWRVVKTVFGWSMLFGCAHEKVQVPKMVVLYLIKLFWGLGVPLHKPYKQLTYVSTSILGT